MKIEVKKLEQELIDSKMQTANLKMKLLEQQNTLSKLKKSSQEPPKQFESKFLEVLEKDGEKQSRDKSQEKEFAQKLTEEHRIVDPMAKFHNNKASLSYAE